VTDGRTKHRAKDALHYSITVVRRKDVAKIKKLKKSSFNNKNHLEAFIHFSRSSPRSLFFVLKAPFLEHTSLRLFTNASNIAYSYPLFPIVVCRLSHSCVLLKLFDGFGRYACGVQWQALLNVGP